MVSNKGYIGIVVQDSYFKDIHIDLQSIIVDMLDDRKRQLRDRCDFSVQRSRVNMNPQAQKYNKPKGPTESLLVFS